MMFQIGEAGTPGPVYFRRTPSSETVMKVMDDSVAKLTGRVQRAA
jgi:hypothetical protein